MIPKHAAYVLEKHGVRVVASTRKNHYKIVCEKNGKVFKIVTSATPSCPFVFKKFEADLLRVMRRNNCE